MKTGDGTQSGNLLLYSVSCPADSLECMDLSLKTQSGWVLCYIILAVNLLPDLLDGILLIYESITMRKKKEIAAGIIMLHQVGFLIVASCVYLQASSASDIMIVKDTVVILFLNNFDQYGYMILERIVPTWLDKLENEIISKYKNESSTSNTHRLASKKKILSTSIHDLKEKIKRLERLREELHNEQKKIFYVQSLKPEEQNITPFNENDYRIMLQEFVHRCMELKAKNSIANSKKQRKITDFFGQSSEAEKQNGPSDEDDYRNVLNEVMNRCLKLKIKNLYEDIKQTKITDFYST